MKATRITQKTYWAEYAGVSVIGVKCHPEVKGAKKLRFGSSQLSTNKECQPRNWGTNLMTNDAFLASEVVVTDQYWIDCLALQWLIKVVFTFELQSLLDRRKECENTREQAAPTQCQDGCALWVGLHRVLVSTDAMESFEFLSRSAGVTKSKLQCRGEK